MGREFKFPFDLDVDGPAPAGPLSDLSTSVLEYIKHTGQHIGFACQGIALIVEDRRQAHRDRVNAGRSAPSFAIGDLVLIRVQVQSNAELNCVAKLSYQVCGPFGIISHSAGSYQVVPLHLPDSNPLSYPGHMFSPVHAGILPCTPIDSSDFRYLNDDHPLLSNPLKRHLHIEHYNEVCFSDSTPSARLTTYPAHSTQPAVVLGSLVTSPLPSHASMEPLPDLAVPAPLSPAPAPQPTDLASALTSSSDKRTFLPAQLVPGGRILFASTLP